MSKVLLIRPPHTYYGKPAKIAQGISVGLPLGILYIASVLEKNGHKVKIYDSLIRDPTLKENGKGLLLFGSSWSDIKEEIESYKPDIVGITNQYTVQMNTAIRVSEIVKEVNKNILTVIGGNHATVAPEDFLKYKSIDIVVRGEGEYSMFDIANDKPLSKIDGISYKVRGKIKSNKQRQWIMKLDSIPFPAYHLINMEEYFDVVKKGMDTRPDQFAETERQVSMITSCETQ